MNAQERHNRNVMLQRVKTYWLKGVLEESLHEAERDEMQPIPVVFSLASWFGSLSLTDTWRYAPACFMAAWLFCSTGVCSPV